MKQELGVVKRCECGGAFDYDDVRSYTSCTECGKIDETGNIQNTWGTFNGTGSLIRNNATSYTYKERQKVELRNWLSAKIHELGFGFGGRHVDKMMAHLDHFFTHHRDLDSQRKRKKNALAYKTVGMNINCKRVCCVLVYLLARKNRIAVSLGEVSATFRFSLKQIAKTLRSVEQVENFRYVEIHPSDYLRRLLDMLRVEDAEQKPPTLSFSIDPKAQKPESITCLTDKTHKLLTICETYDSISGRNPIAIAGAILHIACMTQGYRLPLEAIADKFSLRIDHLRKRIQELRKQMIELTNSTVGCIFTTKDVDNVLPWVVDNVEVMHDMLKAKKGRQDGSDTEIKKGTKRKINYTLYPPPKRKCNVRKQNRRKQIFAQAYYYLQQEGDFKKIPNLEDIELGEIATYEDIEDAKEVLQHSKLSINSLIISPTLIQSLAEELRRNRDLEEDDSDEDILSTKTEESSQFVIKKDNSEEVNSDSEEVNSDSEDVNSDSSEI